MTETQEVISQVCDSVKTLLLEKNTRYGNSALNPIRVFSKSSPDEQLRVRIDDKLSRIRNLGDNDDEDAIIDLIGYLILMKVQLLQGDSNE